MSNDKPISAEQAARLREALAECVDMLEAYIEEGNMMVLYDDATDSTRLATDVVNSGLAALAVVSVPAPDEVARLTERCAEWEVTAKCNYDAGLSALDEVARLTAQLAAAEAERDTLKSRGAELESALQAAAKAAIEGLTINWYVGMKVARSWWCCGEPIPDGLELGREIAMAHVETCDKHPMAALRQQLAAAEQDAARLRQELSRRDGELFDCQAKGERLYDEAITAANALATGGAVDNRESFQDAVRNDPDMTPEQKAKWLGEFVGELKARGLLDDADTGGAVDGAA